MGHKLCSISNGAVWAEELKRTGSQVQEGKCILIGEVLGREVGGGESAPLFSVCMPGDV